MSVFRQRRFGLLLLAVFISAMLVWRPWVGPELQAHGLNLGVDIAGGSRAVLWLENYVAPSTQADVISKLQARIDPYGLLGSRFRTIGENCILCETTQLNDRTKELLTKQGRIEVFIENYLLLTDNDITVFHAPAAALTRAGTVYFGIPVEYTENGEAKLSAVITGGGANLPGVVYLDRPLDTILIFKKEILNEVSDISYDNSVRMFVCTSGELQYPLLVSAVGTSAGGLSQEALDYLENQAGVKQRVILLGSEENFTNVVKDIPKNYVKKYISRHDGESADEWIKRACGLLSDFPLNQGLAMKRIIVGANLQDARDLRAILSNKSPVELSIIGETEVKAGLGSEFVKEALIAGAVALAGAVLLIYFRYRRWKICLAIIGMTACEFAITLGAVSALGLPLGLPELGGILLVIGTGVEHLLIVTDMMLKGGVPQAGSVSVGWRASRALAIVYTAMFLIIAVMIPIGLLGFSLIRGFIIIAIIGTILALLFTRPFYAKILDAISIS